MLAGAARLDITPSSPVWMDGMIRAHPSQGVHDPLSVRCLVLALQPALQNAFAVLVADVCALGEDTCRAARDAVCAATGIAAMNVIVAATHTHSGPATVGFFNPREVAYTEWLVGRTAEAARQAAGRLQPVTATFGLASEHSISHYRRLLATDGHVVMNWEPYRPELVRGPLGVADPDVSVLKLVRTDQPNDVVATLFNHSGHPNVMSGDNYLLSADYPGRAAALVEERFGGVAIFVNGAQGSVDIDGLRDRDWEGVDRLGGVLARAVAAADGAAGPVGTGLRGQQVTYTVPRRKISREENAWAQKVLQNTRGSVVALADGVGDDYLALLYQELSAAQSADITIEQSCLAIGDCAMITFPGELYTEIGMEIKARSPFKHTCIAGLANGYIGYVPTKKAIQEGGYAEDTRRVDAAAEEIVMRESLALLHAVFTAG